MSVCLNVKKETYRNSFGRALEYSSVEVSPISEELSDSHGSG